MAVIDITRAPARIADSPRPAPAHSLRTGDIDLTRLYRAHVSAANWHGNDVTVFVEASSHHAAVKKIASVIGVLEYRKPEEVAERVYNCSSADELIAEGLSDDHAWRLMETGWSGGKATCFVESPLVLLANPGPLLRCWARTQGVRS